MYKAVLFALAALGLAGCITAKNTLSTDQVETLKFAGVDVVFAPNVNIWWGDGERAFAASKGRPATESDDLAKTPEGQAYLRNINSTKIKTAVERNVAGGLKGTHPVRVRVNVRGVMVASAIQRVIIGGHHNMVADVTLVDVKTGAALLPYDGQVKESRAGQGIGGVLVDAALLPDPIDRVVENYVSTYGDWLLRRNPVFDLAASGNG